MSDVTAFTIRVYKLNIKALSHYLNKLEIKFTKCRCKICLENYGKKDTCLLPMTHARHRCKKCCMQTQGVVYYPDEYKELKN